MLLVWVLHNDVQKLLLLLWVLLWVLLLWVLLVRLLLVRLLLQALEGLRGHTASSCRRQKEQPLEPLRVVDGVQENLPRRIVQLHPRFVDLACACLDVQRKVALQHLKGGGGGGGGGEEEEEEEEEV